MGGWCGGSGNGGKGHATAVVPELPGLPRLAADCFEVHEVLRFEVMQCAPDGVGMREEVTPQVLYRHWALPLP